MAVQVLVGVTFKNVRFLHKSWTCKSHHAKRKSTSLSSKNNFATLTDRALVGSWVIDLVIPDSLWPVHGLVEYHELHLLLLHHFLLHAVVLLFVLSLVHLAVIEVVATHAHSLVLGLDHASTSVILKVTLLLIGLNRDVSINAVEVLLLFGKHFS